MGAGSHWASKGRGYSGACAAPLGAQAGWGAFEAPFLAFGRGGGQLLAPGPGWEGARGAGFAPGAGQGARQKGRLGGMEGRSHPSVLNSHVVKFKLRADLGIWETVIDSRGRPRRAPRSPGQ